MSLRTRRCCWLSSQCSPRQFSRLRQQMPVAPLRHAVHGDAPRPDAVLTVAQPWAIAAELPSGVRQASSSSIRTATGVQVARSQPARPSVLSRGRPPWPLLGTRLNPGNAGTTQRRRGPRVSGTSARDRPAGDLNFCQWRQPDVPAASLRAGPPGSWVAATTVGAADAEQFHDGE
jgi:hypothetical protein